MHDRREGSRRSKVQLEVKVSKNLIQLCIRSIRIALCRQNGGTLALAFFKVGSYLHLTATLAYQIKWSKSTPSPSIKLSNKRMLLRCERNLNKICMWWVSLRAHYVSRLRKCSVKCGRMLQSLSSCNCRVRRINLSIWAVVCHTKVI